MKFGNLCIAGHNYIDNRHFGKIHSLTIKNEINADDLSCTNQETNGFKEITLITCNNVKGNRVCIKAREKISP